MNSFAVPRLPDDLVAQVVEIDRIAFDPDTPATLRMIWGYWRAQLLEAITADRAARGDQS